MAKTFYKYQERDIDSQVNWADIGLGMSDMITDQVATRKAKKEAYDDEVRAYNQYLDEYPEGDDANLTSWTSAYSSDMQKKILDNQRAFKNGMISERDNVTFMQNVKNGTKTIFDLATEFQSEYKTKMDRNNSNDPLTSSQPLEVYWMEGAEGYNNYRTSKPIIDPITGLVLMSMKRKDGTYETNSAANLSNRIKATADMFDVNTTITANEAKLGDEEIGAYAEAKSNLKTGQNVTTADKEVKANFEKVLREMSASSLVMPTNVSSILTKSLKFEDILDADGNVIEIKPVRYTFTESKAEAEADPYKILLVAEPGGDGVPRPVFDQTKNGERQTEMALGYMTSQTIGQIDRKVSTQVIGALGYKPQTDPRLIELAQNKQKEEAALKTWAQNFASFAFGTSQTEVDNAAQYLAAGFGGVGTNSFVKVGNAFSQLNSKGNIGTFTMDGSNAAIRSIVNQSGIPPEYQDRIVKKIIAEKGNRVPNIFNATAVSTDKNVTTPTGAGL